MEWLSGNLVMILCLVIGTGLILLEAVMPGFGIAGGFGIALEIVAVIAAWNHFGTGVALLITFALMLLIGFAVFLCFRSFKKGRLSRSPLVLQETESTEAKTDGGHPLADWVHRDAMTLSPLRPGGFVEIDGQKISASTRGTFLEKGVPVVVIAVEGDHLVVRGA